MKKRLLGIALVIVLTLCFSLNALAFSDMPNDWSTEALEHAVQNGLIKGDGDRILPYDSMTRAQMAAIMVRAFGATKTADISKFVDVNPSAWYYPEMQKAVAMKAFQGSGNMLNPDNNITRQEAFVVLYRIFHISKDEGNTSLNQFQDKAKVASWAKEGVAALIASGYVNGANGNVNPTNNITRAEFAAVMDRIVKNYITEPGTYNELPAGNTIIRVGGVTVSDAVIDGGIFVGDGVSENEKVDITNCILSGDILVRGGGTTITTSACRYIKLPITLTLTVNQVAWEMLEGSRTDGEKPEVIASFEEAE